ncbi:MAG: tRNA (adenosine(37)-N6)-threonylcarbamoyltransferase complex ATPase subunit type 1 TsaE [Flavobacteriaceae bacterium]|nr:tRNA (adenosine(37)-N6)-threonylcarbamoyltransferase complex ATPase subunit type 1 TsaE [Flavobacteriaceae bacterium]
MEITYSLEEIDLVAEKLLDFSQTKTLLFYGEMGVGKTTLIKVLCKKLGVTDSISSPTFSLVNQYLGKESNVFHFDFYRIEDEEEVYDIGFEDYLSSNSWILIEWPEKIPNLIPLSHNKISISKNDEQKRTILIE